MHRGVYVWCSFVITREQKNARNLGTKKDQSERACASCTPYHGSPLRHTQMMQLGVFGPLLCEYLPSFSPLKQARPAAINLRRQKINPPIRTSPLLVTAAHKKNTGAIRRHQWCFTLRHTIIAAFGTRANHCCIEKTYI